MSFSQKVRAELLNSNTQLDTQRHLVRECFIKNGVVCNPQSTYHLEFSLSEPTATTLTNILINFKLNPKKIARKGQIVVYIKEADDIADVLNIMGAHKSLLVFESMRIEKSTRNHVNRANNCEVANINRIVGAALSQIEAIEFISQCVGLSYLSEPLEKVARLRLLHQDSSLTEIGVMLDPPVGKSGVNHRLRKICQIAENLRELESR